MRSGKKQGNVPKSKSNYYTITNSNLKMSAVSVKSDSSFYS